MKLDVALARDMLAACTSIGEAKDLRDLAEAISKYMRSREDKNDAAAAKLWAERRLGELLAEQKANGERDAGRGGDRKSRSRDATLNPPQTLQDLGISRSQSSRWQEIAKIPEAALEAYIEKQWEEPDGEITSAGLRRVAKRSRPAANVVTQAPLKRTRASVDVADAEIRRAMKPIRALADRWLAEGWSPIAWLHARLYMTLQAYARDLKKQIADADVKHHGCK